MSLTMDLLKQRRLERQSKNKYISKRVESEILIELKEKLAEFLRENDSVMIEVTPRYVGEFLNILNESLLAIYDYEQVDETKFIFSNREISF